MKSGKLAETDVKVRYNDNGKRINMEELCKSMWEDICSSKNKWVKHACQTPGCAEGYVTIDGNEYLRRSKCALPKEKVKLRKDLPEVVRCCTNSPLPGGKNQKPSKFCIDHQPNSATESNVEVVVPRELEDAKFEAGLMSEEKCKKKENISLFYDTTAGMLALIRPCGIIVGVTEMFTSESYILRFSCSF